MNCSSLTSISVETNNTNYHSSNNCLIKTATSTLILGCNNSVIPTDGSVTTIGNFAFYNCSELTSITIPVSVTGIGLYAFCDCIGLTSITIPKDVENIGYLAFRGCSGLTSISVDTNNINYHSSNNCLITTSTSILILGCNNSIIPTDGSVTTIGKNAFYNCSELNSITISTNVTSIEERVFYGCSALTQITYSGTMAEFEEIEKEPLWNEESSIQKVICTDGDIVI